MPGMLEHRRGSCRCCPASARGTSRRRDERDWRRTEWQQAHPWTPWAGSARLPHDDHVPDLEQANYWAVMRELDSCLGLDETGHVLALTEET